MIDTENVPKPSFLLSVRVTSRVPVDRGRELALKQQWDAANDLIFHNSCSRGTQMPADEFKADSLWQRWINRGKSVLKRDRNPGPKPDDGCRIRRHRQPIPLYCEPPTSGKSQICAAADQNDLTPALMQETGQING